MPPVPISLTPLLDQRLPIGTMFALVVCAVHWTGNATMVRGDDVATVSTATIASTSTAHVKRRPVRTAEERLAWIAQLRRDYEQPVDRWPAPQVDDGVESKPLGRLPDVIHPADNPDSDAKRRLGEMLFFDPRLSGSGQVACGSCHDPDLAWADGRSSSFGHNRKRLSRNSPSIRNSGLRQTFFWDGRADSLESQAIAVLSNPDEMHSGREVVANLIATNSTYREMIHDAFGSPPDKSTTKSTERDQAGDDINDWYLQRVADSLACFQRSVVGGRSRFDAFLRGRHDALKDDELIGLDLFRREGRCMNCHHGPLFTDDQFHDLGLSNLGRRFEDLGRYKITDDEDDAGRFRTPSLRDVTRTAPYMHSGLFDLSALLNLYNNGMFNLTRSAIKNAEGPIPQKSPLLKPLGLNRTDLDDLQSFLATLAEPWTRQDLPNLPPND